MRPIHLMIAAAVLVVDQITKAIVLARFAPDALMPVVPGVFNLVRVENPGIAFGMLGDLPPALAFTMIVVLSVVAIGLVTYLLWKSGPADARLALALSLILGGAIGNLIDRILRGRVVDFLDFYVASYHWPAFNVADSAIVVGAGLLALDILWPRTAHQGISGDQAEVPRVQD
jgi:signal peptidase II